ncbi:MAG TPA: alpha-amylase family glycosyl hydrolase [Phycisphaerae bacterium]|nr:alpha-amylase family glycosyl hydrolase [Phycisphaerae bacterium]
MQNHCRLFLPILIIILASIGEIRSSLYASSGLNNNSPGVVATIQSVPWQIPFTFTYVAHEQPWPSSVDIAGDFNDWSTTANPMMLGADGIWRATIPLTPGEQEYKFVLNGSDWITDPRSSPAQLHPNASGTFNSVIDIPSPWQKLPEPAPDLINPAGLAFDPNNMLYYDPINPHLLRIALWAQVDGLSSAKLILLDSDGNKRGYNLTPGAGEYGKIVWGVVVQAGPIPIRYYFVLSHGEQTLYLGGGNIYSIASSAAANAYTGDMNSNVVTPEWAQHAIWYEIFPERFRNGDRSNDPEPHLPWTSSWYQPYLPAGEHGDFYSYVYQRFYGGDIQGIQEELPYLRLLGINAIYLTPIFDAPSIHKYDPADFRHVDDGFGVKNSLDQLHGENVLDPNTWQWSASDKVFLNFLAAAHAQGFKVIIDVPWGHTGRDFAPFQDVLKNGKNSPFASWFQITSWGPPIHYNGWDGPDGGMPMIATDPALGLAAGYRQYVFAVTRRWMAPDGDPAHGVDGWRLDTAPDVPHPFWIAWRKLVKSINPNALIIGEIWTPAQAWLNNGDQFDGVMNYPFAVDATQFFVNAFGNGGQGIGPQRFGAQLEQLLESYPYQVDLVQQNLIDSHDTDRFVSRFMNPDLNFGGQDRLQDNPHYDIAKPPPLAYTRLGQVAALQATFVGAPTVWYGDEVGMWGPSDPSDRQPMVWQDLMPYADPDVTVNYSLLHYYQRIGAIHRQLQPLQTGFYGQFISENSKNVFAFHRDLGNQHVYVIINRGPHTESVTIPIFASDTGRELLNYLDPNQLNLVYPDPRDPQGRPVLIPVDGSTGYATDSNTLSLQIPPWNTFILAQYSAGRFDGDFKTYDNAKPD